jgi:hypothetical protein
MHSTLTSTPHRFWGPWRLAAALLFVATAPAAHGETVTSFDVPGATQGTFAYGVNAAGNIVGYYGDSSGNHGFLRDATGGFTTINYPGQASTGIAGISSSGVMAGNYSQGGSNPIHGFLLSRGVFTNIEVPGSTQTTVNGISPSGRLIVGTYNDVTGEHGYLLSGGVYKSFDLPGTYTWPQGVNNRGQIVGYYYDAGVTTGFMMDKNGYKSLRFDSHPTIATGINNKGEIVGYTDGPGFIYTPASGFTTLNIDDHYTIPFGVSNNGEIVGYYFGDQGIAHGFAITSVPEPGALSLMSIGALSILAYATRAARMKAMARRTGK